MTWSSGYLIFYKLFKIFVVSDIKPRTLLRGSKLLNSSQDLWELSLKFFYNASLPYFVGPSDLAKGYVFKISR